MKCVAFQCSQRRTNELSDVLVIIFPDSEFPVKITMSRTKLEYFIDYELKKIFFEDCVGFVRNVNHFTVDKFLNHFSSR